LKQVFNGFPNALQVSQAIRYRENAFSSYEGRIKPNLMQCRDFLNATDGSIAVAAQAPFSSHRRFDTSLLVRSAAFLNRCPQSEKWQWDPGDEVAWHVSCCLSRVIGMAL
jgi:hypothetical protein